MLKRLIYLPTGHSAAIINDFLVSALAIKDALHSVWIWAALGSLVLLSANHFAKIVQGVLDRKETAHG